MSRLKARMGRRRVTRGDDRCQQMDGATLRQELEAFQQVSAPARADRWRATMVPMMTREVAR